MNKYPETASVVQVHKVPSDIETLPNAQQLEWEKALSGQLL
jgi:hypothetical protein